MGIIEHRENQERPAESRVQSRYRASVRLSVAPMMDWTDIERKVLQFSDLHFAAR